MKIALTFHWALLAVAGAAWLGVFDYMTANAQDVPKDGKLWVYIGTYTRGSKSEGIYLSELDLKTGKLSDPVLAGKAINPSFVAIHPSKKYLYAVGEVGYQGKKRTGGISAFSINSKTGMLKLLNEVPSGGAGPCHLVVDKTGKYVLAANYGGGSCCAVRILKNGRLGKMTGFQQHTGGSVDPNRQKGPHAHSINMDPGNRFAFCADLGLDKVLIFALDQSKGSLIPHGSVSVKPGAGPRHFAFHPSGRFAYVINEMGNTVTAMDYDDKAGKLTTIQSISTLPKGYKKKSYTAEVLVHPSGKFLYGSNRGHNSIAQFRINQKTGKLTYTGFLGYKINTPRNFRIDPTGQYMLVGNQGSNSVVIARINQSTRALMETGQIVEAQRPVCFRMMAPPQ